MSCNFGSIEIDLMKKRNDNSNLRILMLGFAVKEKYIEKIQKIDTFSPIQTHKLSWSIINGLESNSGVTVDLISALPVSTFPYCKKKVFNYSRWDRNNESTNILIPFINLIGIKHLTRFIGAFYFSIKWAIKTRSLQNRIILLYGLNSALAYTALITSKIFNIKLTCVVTDPPSVILPGERIFTRIVRQLDKFLIIKAVQRFDGLIVLVKSLAETFFPRVPYIEMEGVLTQSDIFKFDHSKPSFNFSAEAGKFIIMYAGGLLEGYGIKSLIKAFDLLNETNLQLWIFGSGPMEGFIGEAAKKDPRIFFGGTVSNDEILKRLRQATVLINPRPTDLEFTKFSFPSKTIEYMASGRPVLSTRLRGIPPEYFNYLIPINIETPEGIAATIRMVLDKSSFELKNIGEKGRDFIIKNKNELFQGKKILNFFHKIIMENKK